MGADYVGTTRKVAVAMAAPTILSVTADEELSCGGAYPNEDTLGFAYDLTTGRALDWTRLLPPALVGEAHVDPYYDGAKIGTITSPKLLVLYRKAVKADASQDADLKTQCVDVLADDSLTLQLWPDARQDAVVVEPFGLPHVVAACGFAQPIRTADLRPLGVNPALLDAIDAAHATLPPPR
jgi:hypothetical protein